jgi:hypothetical protein
MRAAWAMGLLRPTATALPWLTALLRPETVPAAMAFPIRESCRLSLRFLRATISCLMARCGVWACHPAAGTPARAMALHSTLSVAC